MEQPDSDLVRRIWNSIRVLRDIHGVAQEVMANTVRESWRTRAFRAGEQDDTGYSVAEG